MVEHSAVNRVVVGSSPTRGVFFFLGSMVKRLRHRPFTAVTRVQIPLESFLAQQCAELKVISRMPMWLNWQSSWFVISRLSVRVRSSALYNLILNCIMGRFPSGQRGQTVNLLQLASMVRIHLCPLLFIEQLNTIAGWSSLEARRAHNPEVIGSNPIPATRCVSIVPS